MGVEFAHRHDPLPIGDRNDDLAAAAFAEFAHGLRGLVFAVGREIRGAQHEARLTGHRGEHFVELALQAAALGFAIAKEDARFSGVARRLMADDQIEGRQIVG